MAEVRVVFHHVPKNRAIADWDHRLGQRFGIVTKAHAKTATEQDYFHGVLLLEREKRLR